MAFVVQQRRTEIGIRLALGATRHDIDSLFLRHGLSLVICGIGLGVVVALGVSRTLSAFLFGVTATDPTVFMSAPAILAAVALIAVWVPARRATHVDPAVTLRSE
jgi:ABC-type antimicrobial peptide transport system permease subunit